MNQRSFSCQMILLILGGGLGGLLIYTGDLLSEPIWKQIGMSVLLVSMGFFALLGGVEAMIIKRVGFETRRWDSTRAEQYTGLTAQVWGVLFIAASVVLFILAGVNWFYAGGIDAFAASFIEKTWGWGILVCGIGVAAMVNGIIARVARSADLKKRMRPKEDQWAGVLPLVMGGIFLLVGCLLIFAPQVVIQVGKNLVSSVDRLFTNR